MGELSGADWSVLFENDSDESVVPALFCDFCRWVGVTLTPGQAVFSKVAFDGVDPCELAGAERKLARIIFGDVETIPPQARHVLVATCGARGGKSYVLGALRLLHQALTVSLETLAPGELAFALIVAPDLRLAAQTYRYVRGAVEASPALKRFVHGAPTNDSLKLQRPDGVVSVECLPATRGGGAVRARSLVAAVLDECAFFRDHSFKVNDLELYRAIAPRMLRGAQMVIESTPWAESGLLYDLHKENHGDPKTAISAVAATLTLRNDEHTRMYVAREYERDEDNAKREFGAEFMPSGFEDFFDNRAVDAAIDKALTVPAPMVDPESNRSHGADFGFAKNSTALASVERTPDNVIRLINLLEVKPGDVPLKPSVVVAQTASELKRYGDDTMIADNHYRESVAEHLETAGCFFQPAPTDKSATYIRAKTLLNEGRVRLPEHPKLVQQLKDVKAKRLSGGKVHIHSPLWRTGEHGDLVSAFVLAVEDVARLPLPKRDPLRQATHLERETMREKRRIERKREEFNRREDEEFMAFGSEYEGFSSSYVGAEPELGGW